MCGSTALPSSGGNGGRPGKWIRATSLPPMRAQMKRLVTPKRLPPGRHSFSVMDHTAPKSTAAKRAAVNNELRLLQDNSDGNKTLLNWKSKKGDKSIAELNSKYVVEQTIHLRLCYRDWYRYSWISSSCTLNRTLCDKRGQKASWRAWAKPAKQRATDHRRVCVGPSIHHSISGNKVGGLLSDIWTGAAPDHYLDLVHIKVLDEERSEIIIMSVGLTWLFIVLILVLKGNITWTMKKEKKERNCVVFLSCLGNG